MRKEGGTPVACTSDDMREYKSFYKRVDGNEGTLCRYSTRLDTYGCGCQHDCSYCYAKHLLDFRGLWHPDRPAVADIGKIKRRLDRVAKEEGRKVLRLGGMTDCFQPLELRHRVTYKTIEAMNERGIEYLIVTKSAVVAGDEYMELFDRRLAHVQVSITSTTDVKWEHASPVKERIRAVERLYGAGFDAQVRLSPYIPELVDMAKINAIRCDKVLVEFLRCNGFIKRTFPVDYSKHTEKHGGYLHLPIEEKLRLLSAVDFPEVSVCDDVPAHWEYFREHVNYNRDDCCNLRGE